MKKKELIRNWSYDKTLTELLNFVEFESTNVFLVSNIDDGECDVLRMVKLGCKLIIFVFSKNILIHQNIHQLGKG